jgi:hypothetical protein
MLDIATWAQSRIGFYVERQWEAGRWVLGNAPIRLAPNHADLLHHIFTPGADGRLPYDVVGWCEPAKSGKSAIAGLVAQYAALHLDPNSAVVLASNKRDQAASIMYASFAESIKANPALGIEPGRYETTFPTTGSTVQAIASNSRGAAGARFSCVLFDELWAYQYRDDERLWSEFKVDPTRQTSLKFACGYAGYLESQLWLELLQQGTEHGEPVPELAHIDNDGEPACWRNGRTFVFWSHTCRQPWQTPEWIEGRRHDLRAPQFKRMILTEFVEGEGDFVDPDAWEALVDPNAAPLTRGDKRFPVYVGLDIATKPGGDDCALIGVYRREMDGQNPVRIAFHKVWHGGRRRLLPLKLAATVKPYILRLRDDYDLRGVWFDPYQSLQLAEELRAEGVPCFEVSQTHATRGPKDTALWEMVANRELVLYDDPELRKAAASATAKELGNGMIFLGKAGRGKIDLLVALANVADEARYKNPYPRAWVIMHPLDHARFGIPYPGHDAPDDGETAMGRRLDRLAAKARARERRRSRGRRIK